ncbi:MAG: hypothetical protein VB137_08660 [Burkholderia sp.]
MRPTDQRLNSAALAATEGARSAAVDAASATSCTSTFFDISNPSLDAFYPKSVSRKTGAAARSPSSNNNANSPLAGIVASLKSRQTDPLEVKLKEAVHRVGELTIWRSKCCAWSASGRSAAL